MALKAVVIRHLPNSRPVTSAVIESSSSTDVDDQNHYLISQGKDHIKQFIKNLPEFTEAAWYIDIINECNIVIETEKVK